MKQLAWYTIVILSTIAGVFLLWELRTAVILFILSLTVAAILRPIVDFLVQRRLPRGLALAITYLLVLGLVIGMGLYLGGPLIAELQSLATNLPLNYEHIKAQWLTGSWFQQLIARSFPDLNSFSKILMQAPGNSTVQNFLGMTLGSFDLISNIMIVLILSIYWSADQEHFKRLWLSMFPADLRTRWRDVWQNIENEIGSYLRSELIQSLLTVIFLAVGYRLIGLNYPVLLALIGAVGWSIVWFGGLVVVIPALLAGLSISPLVGLSAAIFSILLLSFLEFIVEPRFFKSERLSSLLVVIMVLLMVKQFGIIGFFIAPPLAAAISILANHLFQLSTASATVSLPPPPTVQFEILRERLNTVQFIIDNRAEPPQPEIINLVNRLDKLVNKVNQQEQFTE
jgi:predicted PurR-regulated permease PerM